MESEAKYVLVGVIVLLLSGLIVVALLWLSEVGSLRNSKSYVVYFKDHPLSGLQQDSAVTMRGIKVGTVRSLNISPTNIEMIRVELNLDADAPVKTDTVATINRNLLTGFAIIDLTRGTQGAPPLEAVPSGELFPIIPEGKSELDKIASSLPEMVDRVSGTVDRIHALLSEDNVKSFTASLENIEKFTGTLAKTSSSIESMFASVEKAGNEVTRISKSLKEFADKANTHVDDVLVELRESLKSLRTTLETFNQRSDEALTAVGKETRAISQEAAATSQRLSETATAASSTLESFSKPREILTGPHQGSLGPGERR